MEKKTGEMVTGKVEMSQKMTERVNWIDKQTYWYLMQLLDIDVDEAKEIIPWNIEILREVLEGAVAVLNNHGYNVCEPYISTPEVGRQYRCTLSECGCKSCSCQDEMMEKERLLSNIEDAVTITGLKIISGGEDSIIVKEGSTDKDFEIRVSQLAG